MIKVSPMPSVEEFKLTLKSLGLKATAQRVAVHEAMLELVHASADTVAEKISERGEVKVNTSSVYNILSQMSLYGIYRSVLSANNKMYFDVNNSKHVHLYDTVNHEFKDVADEELYDMIEGKLRKRRFRGYKIDGVSVTISCHPTHRKTV